MDASTASTIRPRREPVRTGAHEVDAIMVGIGGLEVGNDERFAHSVGITAVWKSILGIAAIDYCAAAWPNARAGLLKTWAVA